MAAVDRKLVHKQFNSPIGLYSENNIKETLDREIKAFGGSGIEIGESIPSHLANSAVLKMLQEEEETYTGYKRVAWPPVNETKPFIREFTPQPALQDQQGNYPYPQPQSPQPAGRTSLQPQQQPARQMVDNHNYPSNQYGSSPTQINNPSNPSYQYNNPQSQQSPGYPIQQYNNVGDAKPQYGGMKPTQNNYSHGHQGNVPSQGQHGNVPSQGQHGNVPSQYQPQQHQQPSTPYNSYGSGTQSPNPQLNQAQSPSLGQGNAYSPQHLQPQRQHQPSAYEQHLQEQQSKPVHSNYQFNNPQSNNPQRGWAPVQPPMQQNQSNNPISFQNQNSPGQYPGSTSPMAQHQQPQQSFGQNPMAQHQQPQQSFGRNPMAQHQQPQQSFGQNPMAQHQQPQQTFGQNPMAQHQQPQQTFGQTPMQQHQPQQTFGQTPMHQQQPQQTFGQTPMHQQQPQQYAQQQQKPQQYQQQHQPQQHQPQQYQQQHQSQQHQPQQYQQQFNEPYYGQSQQNSPYNQQVGSQQQQPNSGVITLRQETPISQKPAPIIQSQPAARSYRGGSLMRGDLKWPPPDCRALMEAEAEHERQLALGPQCRPTKMNKVNGDEDYSNFFARHALAHNYPGYKVPPGTQHIYV